jgi:hypothetical protein
MLKGLSQASNKEFQTLCHTQTGILDTVFYKRQLLADKTTPAQEVDEFATIVVGRFNSLNLDMEWSGHTHKGSVFKVSLSQSSTQGAFVADKPKKELPFAEWWDQQTCKLEGCGGRHPTKYHNDLGAHNRPRHRSQYDRRGQARPGRPGTPGRRDQRDRNQRSITFKSDEAKSKFRSEYRQAKHRIHQALADAIVEEDQDLLVNLAGDDEDDGFESAKEEFDDNNDGSDGEAEAMAHAAMSIDSLLNW